MNNCLPSGMHCFSDLYAHENLLSVTSDQGPLERCLRFALMKIIIKIDRWIDRHTDMPTF